MKNLFVFAIVAVALTIFNGCQKSDEPVLIDEQPQAAVKPDVYVENGYLVFKDFETLDSLDKKLNAMSNIEIRNFENQMGYKSAYSYMEELANKIEKLDESEISGFIDKITKQGYFNKYLNEMSYPFDNESYAMVLNPLGKMKVGKTFYTFEGSTQIVLADLSGIKNKDAIVNVEKRINLNTNPDLLKGGEYKLKGVVLADGRLRCSLDLKRDWIELQMQQWVNDELEWVTYGFKWRYYYRFHSYKRRFGAKLARATYFNWKTKKKEIGGNGNYKYVNEYNVNPPTERSTHKTHIYTTVIYDDIINGVTPGTPPTCHNVNVSDFWSDYMSSTHGTLVYTN